MLTNDVAFNTAMDQIYQNLRLLTHDGDLEMEGALPVLHREMPLRVHVHRADDILTAIRIAEEFQLDYTLEHCPEGPKIASVLGKKRVRVAFGPFMIFKSKLELQDCNVDNILPLYRSGPHISLIRS